MENHHAFFLGKSTISMAIFNSYFDITRGYDGYLQGIHGPSTDSTTKACAQVDSHSWRLRGRGLVKKNQLSLSGPANGYNVNPGFC